MQIPVWLKTPGALVAVTGLVSVLVLLGILAFVLPGAGGGLPAWSYWYFAVSALLWVWGIAFAVPRRFRVWTTIYAGVLTPVILTPVILVASGMLASQSP